jgi:hypothetical protein
MLVSWLTSKTTIQQQLKSQRTIPHIQLPRCTFYRVSLNFFRSHCDFCRCFSHLSPAGQANPKASFPKEWGKRVCGPSDLLGQELQNFSISARQPTFPSKPSLTTQVAEMVSKCAPVDRHDEKEEDILLYGLSENCWCNF